MKRLLDGEVIDVICFSGDALRASEKDYIKYYDSTGKLQYRNLNYYLDTEEIDEGEVKDRSDFRKQASLSILQSLLESESSWSQRLIDDVLSRDLVKHSIKLADMLIEELEK